MAVDRRQLEQQLELDGDQGREVCRDSQKPPAR